MSWSRDGNIVVLFPTRGEFSALYLLCNWRVNAAFPSSRLLPLKSLSRSYDVISSAISLLSFLARLVGENDRL